jgi:hypothetical protein
MTGENIETIILAASLQEKPKKDYKSLKPCQMTQGQQSYYGKRLPNWIIMMATEPSSPIGGQT